MFRRGLAHALKSLLIGWLFLLAQATQAGTVTLVLSDNGGPFKEFADTLGDQFARGAWSIALQGKHDAVDLGVRTDLIVTAGSEALSRILTRGGSTPVLATLITRSAFEQVLADHPGSRRVGAIFLDQPAARQAAFLRQLLPDANRIGMLGRRDSSASLRTYRGALSSQGQTLEIEDSESDAAFLPALAALLPRVDAFLAIPDTRLFNRESIRPLLMTALRHRRPVIGYSQSMVTAGALAAVFSSPAQIALQAAELIQANGSQLPPPQYPVQFSIAINRPVAEALGIETRDESIIRRGLGRMRDAP